MTRIVNGVEQPDDPANTADIPARQAAAAARVPTSIRKWQFKAQLNRMNPVHRTNLLAFIATQSVEVQDWWQDEPIIPRDHPNVEAARVALGYTNAQVNATFRNAALIT